MNFSYLGNERENDVNNELNRFQQLYGTIKYTLLRKFRQTLLKLYAVTAITLTHTDIYQ